MPPTLAEIKTKEFQRRGKTESVLHQLHRGRGRVTATEVWKGSNVIICGKLHAQGAQARCPSGPATTWWSLKNRN